jgi:hypothetical protein
MNARPEKGRATDELDGHPAKVRPSSSCGKDSSSSYPSNAEFKGVTVAPIRQVHALTRPVPAGPSILGRGGFLSGAVEDKHPEGPTECRTPESPRSEASRNRGSKATVLYAAREGESEGSRFTPGGVSFRE